MPSRRILLIVALTLGCLTTALVAEERYEARVPDTLDLADRAALSLRVLTDGLDPKFEYEMFTLVDLYSNPPAMRHANGGMPNLNPKFGESLPMMRIMSGSDYNADVDHKMFDAMLNRIGPDGLYYEIYKPETAAWTKTKEDYSNMMSDGRMLLTMLAWYRLNPDPALNDKIEKMVDALNKIAIPKENYVYYPLSQVAPIDVMHYARNGGWKTTQEPYSKDETMWGNYALYSLGIHARALTEAHKTLGYRPAMDLADKILNNLMRPAAWAADNKGSGKGLITPGNIAVGYVGHAHTYMAGIRGMLNYAIETNNETIKDFARQSYEYARSTGIARIGWFGSYTPSWRHAPLNRRDTEPCMTADMVAMALRLSESGIGDYYDDADGYIRNELMELQYTHPKLLPKPTEKAKSTEEPSEKLSYDRVAERAVGSYFVTRKLTSLSSEGGGIEHCCTGNCTNALYYAWESIVRCGDDGIARINLLLNRASPWLDIDSYLPYEGKVVVRNKTAQRLMLRIPLWVDRNALEVRLNDQKVAPLWMNNYIYLEKIAPKDVLTVTFPIRETKDQVFWAETNYTMTFKGGTCIDISPRDASPDEYPRYLRENLKQTKAPMKKTTRFVAEKIISW